MNGRKWLTPNGRRVYTVRQVLNDTLGYRVVTVPKEEAGSAWPRNYSNQSRFPEFTRPGYAQEALDSWAEAEGLLPYTE